MMEPEGLLSLLQSAVASLIIKVTSQTEDADVEHLDLRQDGVKPRNEIHRMDGATSTEGGNDKM